MNKTTIPAMILGLLLGLGYSAHAGNRSPDRPICPRPVVASASCFSSGSLSTPRPPFTRIPCAAEDSVGCYWDASTRGNGKGHSFYSLMIGHHACIKYWDRSYDRKHGHC